MNFVDSQPQSFLDYAWTSPDAGAASAPKLARPSRKQNRCCDQCRKGKRACDAAILEDALLDTNTGSHRENPTTFHYSDVFGSLAPCGNCEKTKKSCTFEWLRSQRILHATTPQPNAVPPVKKRRTNGNPPQDGKAQTRQVSDQENSHWNPVSDMGNEGVWASQPGTTNVGLTFADFPCGIPAFDDCLKPGASTDSASTKGFWDGSLMTGEVFQRDTLEIPEAASFDFDSGHGSSIYTASPEGVGGSVEDPSSTVIEDAKLNGGAGTVTRIPSKRRRRRSRSTVSTGSGSHTSLSFRNDLLSSASNGFLADGLLRVYHDSFEAHLSCWLTEKTCPYSKDCDVSLPNDSGPDWSRIYHRVFKLDQSPSVRGRLLSMAENRAASRALNLAIFSFASQWAVPKSKRKDKYPFHSAEDNGTLRQPTEATSSHVNFDRPLQLVAWHQASKALHEAADIESFRVVLAHIVFSLTQQPVDESEEAKPRKKSEELIEPEELETKNGGDVKECQDLLSKLNLTIRDEGPPVHLEQGLRLIHSLRSRMAMTGAFGGRRIKKPRCWKHLQTSGLEAADRATVDVLFWLGIMFDTLSSAMHKRPLVVSLEDSELSALRGIARDDGSSAAATAASESSDEDFWDDSLFRRQRIRRQTPPARWPCAQEEAVSLLCEAAPIKVLLFRKVTRIQTLLSRHAKGEKIEAAVHRALEVYEHWQATYAPFIRDCVHNHDKLPERIQSWYVCLAGHWHLATLLLADLVEAMDETERGIESKRRERDALNFVARFREENCRSLSDIASRACLQEDLIVLQSKNDPFSIGQGALLSEPWSDVLVRAFAIAGAVLLENAAASDGSGFGPGDAFKRVEDCVRALRFLGRRSDKALLAADLLEDALRLRKERGRKVFHVLGLNEVACAC